MKKRITTASLHKLATGRKLATTHLNVSNRQMCRCTGFKSGDYNKSYNIANLINKLNFYKLIPYSMDNMLTRSAQTGPPNVRKRRPVFPPAGRSSHCTRQVACRTSFLSTQADVIASFSLSKPIRPLVN